MEKSSNKKVAVIVIVVILILGAFLIPMLTSDDGGDSNTPDGSGATTTNDEVDPNAPDGSDGETQTGDDPQLNTLTKLTVYGESLRDEINAAVAAGCGDDLDAFNQQVTELVARLGTHQEGVAAAFAAMADGNVTPEQEAAATSLSAVTESIDEDAHPQLQELSNNCNNQ